MLLCLAAIAVVSVCSSGAVSAKEKERLVHAEKGDGDDVSGIKDHPPSSLETITNNNWVNTSISGRTKVKSYPWWLFKFRLMSWLR
jgi:hypothetical protein